MKDINMCLLLNAKTVIVTEVDLAAILMFLVEAVSQNFILMFYMSSINEYES